MVEIVVIGAAGVCGCKVVVEDTLKYCAEAKGASMNGAILLNLIL